MPLRWLINEIVVDGSTFTPSPPKDLVMEGWAMPMPSYFNVYQVHDSLIRQLLDHIGIPESYLETSFGVVGSSADQFRSDRSWRLPSPRGWRKSTSFRFFADESDQASPIIRSSRLGEARLHLQTPDVVIPVGGIPIGIGGAAKFEASLYYAVDPELSVEVITGEELMTYAIRNLTEDVGARDEQGFSDVAARIELSLGELTNSLPSAYRPPSDWSVVPATTFVSGDAGSFSQVGVELNLPSPGTGYFAVTFVDAEDPELGETTNAFAISVDRELKVTANDPAHFRLRLPIMAY